MEATEPIEYAGANVKHAHFNPFEQLCSRGSDRLLAARGSDGLLAARGSDRLLTARGSDGLLAAAEARAGC